MMKPNFKRDLKYQTMGADEPELVSDQELSAFKPAQTFGENMLATYNLSAMDTTWQSALQYNEIRQAENQGGELLPLDKLKEAYPDLPGVFKEPKSQAVAQIIADRTRARNDLARQVAEGPQGTIYGMSRFVAASLPHAIDPANVGAGVAVGALTAGFGGPVVAGIRATAMGARALEAAAVVAKAAPNVAKFAGASAEAFAGNAIGEGAVYASATKEGRDYSLEDAFYNTVGGSVLIPGAILGFHKSGAIVPLRAAGKFTVNRMAAALNRIDPKYGEMLLNSSVARLKNDKLPVADVIADHAIKELSGETPSFAKTNEYVREPLTPERPLYAATYEPGTIKDVQTEVHDEFFGDAAYLSDDPRVANGASARSIKEGTGRVIELNHDDLNLIDLNQPLPAEVHASFEARGVDKADLNSRPGIEIMRSLQDQVQLGEAADVTPYAYSPMNVDTPTEGQQFYHGTKSSLEKLSDADVYQHTSVKNLYGEGLYLTDNPNVAKSYAKTKGKGETGKVLSAKLKNLKLVDLERPLPSEVANVLNELIEEFGGERLGGKARGSMHYDVLRDAMSESRLPETEAMDVFANINSQLSELGYDGLRHEGGKFRGKDLGPHNVAILFEDRGYVNGVETGRFLKDKIEDVPFGERRGTALDDINTELRTAGYDGYLHDGSSIEGTPREPHNSVAVFNREKLREVAEHGPEVERLPPADPATVTRMGEEALSPLSDFAHENPKAQLAEVERLIAEPPKTERLVEVQAAERELFEDLDSREKQGLLTPEEVTQVQELRENVAEGDTILQHLKDAASCILLGDE